MRLFVPEHLRNIVVVKQLCKLIEGYADYYEESVESSFDDYEYYMRTDPVKKFINLCLPEEKVYEGVNGWNRDQEYESVVNYLASLFYSVKGTYTVFDYMQKYLNLEFIGGDIIYTPRYVEFSLDTLNINDENLFYTTLKDFLDALLYYQELNVNIGKVNLSIENRLVSYINGGAVVYRYSTALPYQNT